MTAANPAPGAPASGERSAPVSRPARLCSRDAERRFAELLDDAAKASRLSNAAVGDACDVTESRVRAWRDPNGNRPLTAYRLLQLPDGLLRSVLERVLVVRAELRADLGPANATVAASVAIASMGRALADIGVALADGTIDPREGDALASLLLDVIRDARVLLVRLGRKADA